MSVDDVLTVVVEENPTTGYSWILNESLLEENFSIVSNEYKKYKSEMNGVGGIREISIKMVQPEDSMVQMAMAQPWTFSGFESNGWDESYDSYTLFVEPADSTKFMQD